MVRGLYEKWFKKLHGRIAVSRPAMEFVNHHFLPRTKLSPTALTWTSFHRMSNRCPSSRTARSICFSWDGWRGARGSNTC